MGDIIVVRPGTALWRRLSFRRPALAARHRAGARGLHPQTYAVDLGQVLSKYIHETEKNLHRLFEHAERADVLVYDDADALFGHGSAAAAVTMPCPDGLRGCVHLTREEFLGAVAHMRHR
jgi:ATPase family associated with various cellular activities (AAA).